MVWAVFSVSKKMSIFTPKCVSPKIVSYVSHGNQQKQAIMVLKNPNPGTIWQPTPVETMPGLTQYLKYENISIYKWFLYNHTC